MATALEAVLNLRANEQAQEQQRSDNLTQAVQLFAQARQQAQANQLAQLQYKAGLAEKGLSTDPSSASGFKRDTSLMSPLELLLQQGKAADAQKSIVEAGGVSPNIFGNQSSVPSTSPIGQVISGGNNTKSNLISNQFNSMGVATGYLNPDAEVAKKQIDNQADISKDQNTRATKLKELTTVIDFFEKKVNELPSGSGIMGKVRGMGAELGGKIGINAKAAAYDADLQGMRSQIARGLGEVGNLSETEQAAAIKLLPVLSDNDETKSQKISNFRDYIATKLSGLSSSQVGNKTEKSIQSFKSESDVEKANLPKGTLITINGRQARID